jgi:hypothetical protein
MLDDLWADGVCNGAELHRQLGDAGFKGSLRVVTEWATRKRQEQKAAKTDVPRKAPSARTVAKMLTTHRHGATAKQIELLTIIAKATPDIVTARASLDLLEARLMGAAYTLRFCTEIKSEPEFGAD